MSENYVIFKQIKNKAFKIIADYKLRSSSTNIAAGVTYLATVSNIEMPIKKFSKIVKITPVTMNKKIHELLTTLPFSKSEFRSFKYIDPLFLQVFKDEIA